MTKADKKNAAMLLVQQARAALLGAREIADGLEWQNPWEKDNAKSQASCALDDCELLIDRIGSA